MKTVRKVRDLLKGKLRKGKSKHEESGREKLCCLFRGRHGKIMLGGEACRQKRRSSRRKKGARENRKERTSRKTRTKEEQLKKRKIRGKEETG